MKPTHTRWKTALAAFTVLAMVIKTLHAGETVLDFSGTDSYVDLDMPDVLQLDTDSPLTIEGWVYLNSVDDRDMLYCKNNGRNTSGYTHLFGFYENGRIGAYTGSAWREPDPKVTVDTERWMHVAFSFDGTNLTYYIDGESVGSSAFNYNNVEANTVKLGGYSNGSDINGMKSEIRVWDHARTYPQIADGRHFRLSGDEDGLLGYWPMNEGSGTDALDSSGNASTGTVINASWTTTEDLTFLPPDAGYLPGQSFTLADIETGNPSYTISNEVDVTSFPIPENYDLYQVTESGDVSAVDTNAWTSTNSLPTQLDFTTPLTATNITLYAWFTNSVTNVTMRRAEGKIDYIDDVSDSVLEFFAPASYVDLGNPEALQLPFEHPLTIEGWVYFKTLGTTDMLFSKNNASRGSTYSYMFGVRDSGTKFSAYTGHGGSPATTWVDIPLAEALQPERWYHLAFAYDGTNLSGYVDGVKIGEVGYSYGNYEAHTVTLGGYSDDTDANALRADVRLWNHARGPKDMALYRDRRLNGAEPGLVGYWPLNDWSGTKVLDRTANASTGTIVNARSTLSEGFALASPPEDFALASAFTLADLETGSVRFTNSNEVDLVSFPLPVGYDSYQVTLGGKVSAIDTNAWLSTNTIPAQLDFPQPAADSNIILYAWFTNSVTNATLLRGEGSIYYTEVLPVPNVRPALTRERLPGTNVVITAMDIDLGSTGGEANALVLDVVDRIAVAADPGDDQTPGEPYVSLSSEGDYPVLLWLKNEAGNPITSVETCLVSVVSYTGTNTWTGLGYSDDWHDGANWGAGVPVAGQDVVIESGSLRLTAATAALNSFQLADGATLTVEGWDSAIQAEEITIAGTVTHEAQTVTEPDSVTGEWVPEHRILLKGTNFTLTSTGALNADYKGYLHEAGPGRAIRGGGGYGSGGGGGYGGHGGSAFDGQTFGPSWGNPADPWQPGSGGGLYSDTDGVAGGAIRIEMSGAVTIDGTVTANGGNGGGTHRTAASGGGIAIYCDTFQGAATGLIRADGGRGNYYGGNGGGGRIALHFNPIAQAVLTESRPPVRFSAHAWRNVSRGYEFTVKAQMGTLYLTDTTLLANTPTSTTVLDGQRFWYTRMYFGSHPAAWSPASLAISNCVVGFAEGFELDVGEDLVLSGTTTPLIGDDTIRAGLTLYALATNQLYGARLKVGRDFTIGPNTWFHPHTEGYSAAIVGVRVERDLRVYDTGGIDADHKGYMPDKSNANGPGAGVHADSGGSYGGLGGGSAVGQTYGLAALPLDPGSPGGWRYRGNFTPTGKGGGVIHVLAGGTLRIDGLLTANGDTGTYYNGPAGSGGSIFLAGMGIQGSGVIQARGGKGQLDRAPGGGGRIAVWHHLPLSVVEERIASGNTIGLLHNPDYTPFKGELDAGVFTSILDYQPEPGTTGFYTVGGTMIILR